MKNNNNNKRFWPGLNILGYIYLPLPNNRENVSNHFKDILSGYLLD